jgi:hypothetical protein
MIERAEEPSRTKHLDLASARTSKFGAQTSTCHGLTHQIPEESSISLVQCKRTSGPWALLLYIVHHCLQLFEAASTEIRSTSNSMYSLMLSRRDEVVGAIPPPPGITPNFVDPPSRAHIVIVVNAVCSILSVSFVGLRSYTAVSITRQVRIDDCKPCHCSCSNPLLISIDLLIAAWVRILTSNCSQGPLLIRYHGFSFSLYYFPFLTA